MVMSNSGSLPLGYEMRTTAAGSKDLALKLVLEIKVGVTQYNESGSTASGVEIYRGSLSEASLWTAADGTDRILRPGAGEELCFLVALPSSAGDRYLGSSASTMFSFGASSL